MDTSFSCRFSEFWVQCVFLEYLQLSWTLIPAGYALALHLRALKRDRDLSSSFWSPLQTHFDDAHSSSPWDGGIQAQYWKQKLSGRLGRGQSLTLLRELEWGKKGDVGFHSMWDLHCIASICSFDTNVLQTHPMWSPVLPTTAHASPGLAELLWCECFLCVMCSWNVFSQGQSCASVCRLVFSCICVSLCLCRLFGPPTRRLNALLRMCLSALGSSALCPSAFSSLQPTALSGSARTHYHPFALDTACRSPLSSLCWGLTSNLWRFSALWICPLRVAAGRWPGSCWGGGSIWTGSWGGWGSEGCLVGCCGGRRRNKCERCPSGPWAGTPYPAQSSPVHLWLLSVSAPDPSAAAP